MNITLTWRKKSSKFELQGHKVTCFLINLTILRGLTTRLKTQENNWITILPIMLFKIGFRS